MANEKLPDIRDSPDRSSRQSNTPVEMPNIATANLKLPSSAGPIFCHLCLAYCLRPCDFSVHSYETKTWKKGSSPANPLIQPVIHPPESQNLRDLVCHCGVSSQIFISTKPELRPPVFLTNSTSAHGATTKFELLATGDRAAPIEPTSAPPETTSSLTSQTESASNRQYCEICDIYTMGEVVMESHLKGKQHKENLSGKAVTASSSPTANRTAIKSADLSNKSPAELYDRRRKLIGTIEPLKKSIRQMEKSEDELTAKIRHLADSIEANREMTEQLKISLVTQSARNEFNLHIERLTADHRNFCDKRAAVAADRDSTIQLLHEYTGEIQGINDALKSQLNGLFACKPCNMEFTSQLELQSHQQGKRHKEKLQKNAGRPIT